MRSSFDQSHDEDVGHGRNWRTYIAIIGALLILVVALAGGIIWYNSKQASALAITTADRLMREVEDKIIERIKLLYDPMFAIVSVASLMPEFTSPSIKDNAEAKALILKALRTYPQILSLYVGFDNGDFFMITHIVGKEAPGLRQKLGAPPDAVFAVESITADDAGRRMERWSFLAEDGSIVANREPAAANFDPRERPWYRPARESNTVQPSDLYVFASSGELGFTLSRSFDAQTPGVMGADLAAVDLANFLRAQRITPGSHAFIFTGSGGVIPSPDDGGAAVPATNRTDARGETAATKPKTARNPTLGAVVSDFAKNKQVGPGIYTAADRDYIGRIAEIPARYGRAQFLAVVVPTDEIVQPVTDIRNETLLYSIAFLVFALPLYVTLIVAWIDRRVLGSRR